MPARVIAILLLSASLMSEINAQTYTSVAYA